MDDLLQNITAINNGTAPGGNQGTSLDLSAGYTPTLLINGNAPAGGTSGQALINPTGNSVLDAIASISNLAVNTVSKGLGAYSSYLEASAVANAANRLNTTPAAIQGSLPTVPTDAQTIAQQQSSKTVLYVMLASGALLIGLLVLRKRRR